MMELDNRDRPTRRTRSKGASTSTNGGDQGDDICFSPNSSNSPKGSDKIGVLSGNSINPSRRIFTNEFKLSVLEAFNRDPECIGNQRATARKFGIHRRQVQKWLQQPQINKEDSLDDHSHTNSSEELPSGDNLSKGKKNQSEKSENNCADKTSPSTTEDLSKMSASAMALSLNLSMNSALNNSSLHSNPLSLLQLQAPRISPSFQNKIKNVNYSPANLSNSSSGSQPQNTTYNNDNGNGHHHLDVVDEIAYMYPHEDFNLLRQALIRNEVTFTKVKKNGIQIHMGSGDTQSNRARFTSPPPQSPSKTDNYSVQQAFELIRNQNDYVKLLAQSGLNLPYNNDLHNFSELHNQKYPSWLPQNGHLLPSSAFNIAGNGGTHKKKHSTSHASHTFVSPKVPSNSKPKTVAAALAASRQSPTLKVTMIEPTSKSRTSHQRKRQPRPKSNSNSFQEEEFIDPTTMLEVTSSAVEENGVDLTNHYQSNGISFGNHVPIGYGHSKKSSPDRHSSESDSELTKYLALQAYACDPEVAGDARALARKFGLNIRVVMKWIKEGSVKFTGGLSNSVRLNGGVDLVPTFGSDNNTLQTKTTANGGVDMSVLKKTMNGMEHGNFPNLCSSEDIKKIYYNDETDDLRSANLYKNKTFSSTNKRKNSKPNQICDFLQEDNICFNEGPVDMIVPIKKRRLSTQE